MRGIQAIILSQKSSQLKEVYQNLQIVSNKILCHLIMTIMVIITRTVI